MEKRIALLLCSTAALMAVSSAGHAAPVELPSTVPATQTYADLLAPISNAAQKLQIDDAVRTLKPRARLQLADHHHHHHHHHNSFPGAIIGGIIGSARAGAAPSYYERCHWTWGQPYWNGDRWVRPRVRDCD